MRSWVPSSRSRLLICWESEGPSGGSRSAGHDRNAVLVDSNAAVQLPKFLAATDMG